MSSSSSGCDILPQVVGPIVGVAVLIEAVTIIIAIASCVYISRKAANNERYGYTALLPFWVKALVGLAVVLLGVLIASPDHQALWRGWGSVVN
jgi:hypothetical protein